MTERETVCCRKCGGKEFYSYLGRKKYVSKKTGDQKIHEYKQRICKRCQYERFKDWVKKHKETWLAHSRTRAQRWRKRHLGLARELGRFYETRQMAHKFKKRLEKRLRNRLGWNKKIAEGVLEQIDELNSFLEKWGNGRVKEDARIG